MDGPSLEYQGDGLLDFRFWPLKKDGLFPGRVPALLNSPYIVMCDNIPQATGTATLAALQTVAAANTSFTLSAGALAQANGSTAGTPTLSPGIPILPMTAQTAAGYNGAFNLAPSTGVVNVIALDFGFTTGTTTTGGTSQTITVPDSTIFYPGQWIAVGGAGNSGKTLPLITQVLTLASSTTITVSLGALAAVTNAPIGNMLPPGLYFPGTPPAAWPYLMAGPGAFLNPPECVTRCISVTGSSGGTGSTGSQILISGYDVYGQPMTQLLNGPVGATTVYTTKAFKYIASIKTGAAWADTSHQYSIGISDVYGYNVRVDKWEYTEVFWAAAFETSGLATQYFTPAVKTTPATNATGDVRGTYQVGANGPLSGGSYTSSNGTTNRLMMAMSVPLSNLVLGTPQNPAPFFGVTQA
jgi:hypothetical protein